MKWKVEIIDDQINNQYRINKYAWKKNKWWQEPNWLIHSTEYLGKRHMCPEIRKGKLTIEAYFERDVKYTLDIEGIVEVHRIIITTK